MPVATLGPIKVARAGAPLGWVKGRSSPACMIFLIFRKQTSTALCTQIGRGHNRCEQMRELASRRSSAYTVEALLDRCEALIDERFVLSIGENVGPVVFDSLAN